MLELLKDKKVIFFDVGYTLDFPATGDWMFTKRFWSVVGDRLDRFREDEIVRARDAGWKYLAANHLVPDVEQEFRQMSRYYTILSDELGLGLTGAEAEDIARDRTWNMLDNYVLYPDAGPVVRELAKTHRLGLISDTWPSIEDQLTQLGIRDAFSFCTYSFELGLFKPDRRIFLDALAKSGCRAEETAFVDDNPLNLESAASLGITPVLIAANPVSDVDTPYRKIRSLSELLGK